MYMEENIMEGFQGYMFQLGTRDISKIMSLGKLTDYLVHVFEAPPGERSEKDIRMILPFVVTKTSCLKTLEKETVAFIFQKSRLVHVSEDDIIVRQGERGDTFYIILHGSVSIYVDTKQDESQKTTEDDKELPSIQQPPSRSSKNQDGVQDGRESRRTENDAKDQRTRSAKRVRSSHSRGSRRQTQKSKKQQVLDRQRERNKLGVHVATLGRYQSFGELALLYPNNKRNASVIADEHTDLLAISFEIFKSTLQESLERDQEEKRLFVQTHPFFSKWNLPQQRQLQWSLKRSTHKLGGIVIRQGDSVNGLHFLVSGRARLSAEPLRHRQQFPQVFAGHDHTKQARPPGLTLERHDSTLSEIVDEMRSTKGCHFPSIDPLTYIRRTDGYAAAEKILFEKQVDLCLIEEGEVICDCELLLGLEKNIFTVTAASACMFYHLEKKVFDRLILKKVPHTLKMMKMLAETKLSSRLASTQGKRIPILSPLLLGILNVHIIDPFSTERKHLGPNKTLFIPKLDVTVHRPKEPKVDKVNAVILDWFIHGKTPTVLQPLMKDAIYQREMMHVRAREREDKRKRSSKNKLPIKSLERRIKESFITNLKESVKAENTMKKLSLQRSVLTPVSRWK